MQGVDKKKILYLVTQTEPGGAQKYIYDLATHLDDSKYVAEVAIGKGEKEDWLKKLEEKGFKVWYLKHLVREVNPWHDFLSAFELNNLFDKIQPDIIHLNSSKIGSTGAVLAWIYKKLSHRPDVKIVYTAHGFVFTEPLSILRKGFYIWSERISGLFKDKIICVSEQDKIIGLNHKIANHKKFITIRNGIELNNLKFLEKKQARKKISLGNQLPAANNWVGTIANLYSTKGLEYLIRSAKILTEKYSKLIFVVIGEGSLRKNLEEKIEELNLENKFFLIGTMDNAAQYLKAFNIFCLPSIKEGLPYTLLEAMAARLPVIVTRVGGMVEVIEPDVNGLTVPPKKPRELARAIETLLNNTKLQNKFIKNNLEKIKKFNLEKMVCETEKLYLN